MAVQKPLDEAVVTSLAKALGEAITGRELTSILDAQGLSDGSDESTKWKRIQWVMTQSQKRTGSANESLALTVAILNPARFVGRPDEHTELRANTNEALSFAGLSVGDDGVLRSVRAATTLSEAEDRARRIRAKFKDRRLHPELLRYCEPELLQENYFHAVFEATKGLAQRVRDRSGTDGDGAVLIDRVFGGESPLLAFNTLQTETERSQHRGFAAMLKGCFAGIRNPTAHVPKILWEDEDDAADYLTFISLLHRGLDKCVNVPQPAT